MCALLNQCVYILFVLLLMIMMKKQVDAKKQVVSCSILRIKTEHSFSKFIYRVLITKKKKTMTALSPAKLLEDLAHCGARTAF